MRITRQTPGQEPVVLHDGEDPSLVVATARERQAAARREAAALAAPRPVIRRRKSEPEEPADG